MRMVFLFVCFILPALARAESLMYMDDAGNILFAENVSQIPERYRSQVIPSTPKVTDPKEVKKIRREFEKAQKAKLKAAEKERKKEEKARKELAEKKQKEMAREQKKKKKKHKEHKEDIEKNLEKQETEMS